MKKVVTISKRGREGREDDATVDTFIQFPELRTVES